MVSAPGVTEKGDVLDLGYEVSKVRHCYSGVLVGYASGCRWMLYVDFYQQFFLYLGLSWFFVELWVFRLSMYV